MIDSTGLKKRKTYDEIVNIIQDGKDKIKYQNRQASLLMRTNQSLSLLDLDGLGEQENNIANQKVAETIPISIGLGNDRNSNSGSSSSSSSSGTYQSVNIYRSFHPEAASSSQIARRPKNFAMSEDSAIDSEADDLDDHLDEQQKTIAENCEAAA